MAAAHSATLATMRLSHYGCDEGATEGESNGDPTSDPAGALVSQHVPYTVTLQLTSKTFGRCDER
jgi:hypothetical protein